MQRYRGDSGQIVVICSGTVSIVSVAYVVTTKIL